MVSFATHILRRLTFFVSLFCLVLAFGEVDPVVIQGSHFFYRSNGSEFQIRGVGYQSSNLSSGEDMLSDSRACDRDVPYLEKSRTNLVRIDGLDPELEHSACMESLASAGIYVLASLIPPSLLGNSPQPAYDTTLYNYTTAVIDNMGKFSNLLGFYAPGIQDWNNGPIQMPLSKAIIRDAKAYIKSKGLTEVPVGVLASPGIAGDSYSDQTLDFFSCDEVHSDFFGYQYSGPKICPSNTSIQDQAKRFADASMPVFLLSDGCNNRYEADEDTNYPFSTLYSRDVADALSGAILYEYFGMFTVDPEDITNGTAEVVYTGLSSAMAALTTNTINRAQYTPPPSKTTSCPTVQGDWTAAGPTLPPKPNNRVCDCMRSTLECVADQKTIDDLNEFDGDTRLFDLMNFICGSNRDKCNGTGIWTEQGAYGAFNSCPLIDRWSWDMSYWSRNNDTSDRTCAARTPENPRLYAGVFTKQNATANLDPECKFLLDQAGVNGTGTITNFDFARSTGGSTTSNSSPQPENTGLSVGAKAGIGIGVAIGVIAALLLALFVLHRKKKAIKTTEQFDKPELDGSGVTPREKNHGAELGEGAIVEAPYMISEVHATNNVPWELDGNAIRGELPAMDLPAHSELPGEGPVGEVTGEHPRATSPK